MFHSPPYHWRLYAVLLVTFALVTGFALRLSSVVTAGAPDPVTAAWAKAQAAGSYHFTSDIVQITMPTAKVTNVGRSSRTEELHLTGQTDLRQQTMAMALWSNGGSVLQANSGLGIKVADGKTFVRQGEGNWEEKPDFAVDGLAPQGDFLAYLVALRDVQAHPPEQRSGIHFTRYSFTLDGPTFAAYMHQRLEETLRAKGELPPGMQLEIPRYYAELTGDGELWIGADGLPLRQILHLQFPPQKDEQVQAQMVIDFSDYGTPVLSAWALVRAGDLAGLWAQRPALPATLATVLPPTLLLLTALLGLGLVFYYRRRRLLETALATAVITSLVIGPVLSTMTQVRFFDAQTAKAADQEEQQAAANAEREIRDALGKVEFNPHRNPLANSATNADNWATTTQSPNLSIAQSPNLQSVLPTDNGVDTDGDTLSDFVEQRVGTDPVIADSDSDGLRDNLEVRGFTFGGKSWYLNPNALDSNNDGQGDVLEWGLNTNGTVLTTPQDTDADGTPDLFDNDNDNDGVADRRDLSPYVANSTIFGENAPLQLRLDNLTANKPAFVEFQLRPQDPKHLWYAFNVLDWPQDSAGQVQDVDNKSYADVATSQARVPDGNEANGDLKLFPMLEIRMPAAGANLPPQSDLTPFNITVNNFTADGATKVAYVPLTVVKDEADGQRVAFSGQMRYLPTGSWPSPHAVRLVWGVQALVDLACDPQDAQAVAQGCQPDGYIHNVPQMLHSYYDAWTLTGLTVREEHGTTMDLIYEDPAVDPNKKDDAALWALSFVLDHHFALGRDEDNNGQRDLTVNEIANRFDRTRNAVYSEDQRFAVPNILRVSQQSYTTLDQAVAATTMTETVKLLNTVFAPAVTADRAIKPLILFAQENSGRNLTLDVLRAGGGYVSQSGAVVTFNMAPTGQPAQAVAVTAGIKWTTYCVPDTGALTWQACPADLYWETLEQRYGGLPVLPGETDRTFAEGSLHLTQLYYVGFTNGFYGIVQQGTQIVVPPAVLNNAATTTQRIRSNVGQASSLLLLSTEAFARALIENINPDPLRDVNDRIRTGKYAALLWDDLKSSGGYWQRYMDTFVPHRDLNRSSSALDRRIINNYSRAVKSLTVLRTTPLAVAGATMMVVSQIYNLIPDAPSSGRAAISALTAAVSLGLNVALPIIQTSRIARLNGSLQSVLTRTAMVDKAGRIGAGVGLALALGITWGTFIYSAATSGYAAGSPELNQAFAGAVAATIFIMLTTLLASTVIGGIIAAIIAVIDLILTAICEAGADSLRSVPGLGGSCFTLGAGAIKVLTYLIYNYDSMINTDRTDLVVMGEADINLADPSKGYVAGNTLSVNLPVTTTIVHKDPDASNGVLINGFLYLFSEANLRSSTYKYSLTAPNAQDITVARDQMPTAWAVRERNTAEGGKYVATTMYRGQASTNPPGPVTGIPLTAGINRPAEFYFNMGYAIPAYECWMMPLPFIPFVPPIPVCYTRDLAGTNSTKMDNIKFDIFPATFDGFMSVISNGDGGLRLAWDSAFPSLKDADGDGLLSSVYRGLDPNDNSTDADNDGLSDTYELEHRQGGFALSPVSCDSDLDGLTDEQEMQLNSDPGVADSDNDGLLDGQEVWHRVYTVITVNNQTTCTATANWSGGWDLRINASIPFVAHVSSDPLSADSDGDSLSDLAEKQLAEATCTAQEVANGRTCEGNPLRPVDNQNRPFHPGVYNTPPLTLLLETNDFDGFLAPGQTLRYTNTVIANAPMAPGVLDLLPPAPPFAVQPPAVALPFNSLTFSGSQTLTVPSNLTVQSGVAIQDLVVGSRVRTRLVGASVPAWSFDPITLEPALTGFTTPFVARNTGLTANRPDRPDSYLLSSLLSTAAAAGGTGDIQAYTLPSGASQALDADNLNRNILRGANPPRSVTNNHGDSLVVWDQVENCRILNITLLSITEFAPDHVTSGIEPYITVRDSVGNADVRLWTFPFLDMGVGTYNQGFPVTVNVCGDYTISMWESGNASGGDTLIRSQTLSQNLLYNLTLNMSNADTGIFIDVNTPARDLYTVAGALVGQDGTVKQRLTFPPPSALVSATERRSFNPVVASDGANFLVAYEMRANNGSAGYVTQPVAANGAVGSATFANIFAPTFDTQSKLAMDLAWLGSTYRAVANTGNGALYSIDHDSNGGFTVDTPLALASDSAPPPAQPGLAWDAISGRWALAYVRNGTTNVRINRYPTVASTTSDANTDFLSPYKQVDLAWNGQNSGWLFQGQLTDNRQVFVALDADLVQRASNATQISWTSTGNAGLALACPAVTALPVLDLRMEELPGATTFVDSSGRSNNAVCGSASQCPTVGAPGGVYANGTAIGGGAQGPASDYAFTFNSNQYLRAPDNASLDFDANRSLTWLTWVKTTVGSPIMRKGLGGANDLLLSITSDTGRLRMGFGSIATNTLTATGPDLRDNQWHQVAVTLDRATNTATLYVDGTARGSGSFTGSFVTTDDLFIGSSNVAGYVGALDNLQIYHSALAADTISALYNRTLQAYCAGSSPTATGNGVQWAKLIVRQPDQRGGAITVSNSINLKIDGDQPTASIALPASVTVQGGSSTAPRVFVIGGTASDPTSSIARVEVSVNNGPWQVADGAESWTFALSLAADGRYEIHTRATDAVGNVGAPSAIVNLFVDGTAPQMSINLSSVKATFRTINKQYYVFLQGALADPPIPGGNLNLSSIKAQVQLFNGGGQAVSELQTVSRNPDDSWQLFYLFPDSEKAPSGRYTVELQATDGLGNQFKQRLATPLVIDSLGPVATFTKSDVSKGLLATVITGTVTVGGQISETLAVGSANVNFTPLQQVLPYADSVLQLNLEEQLLGETVAGPVSPQFFVDSSTQFNHAACNNVNQCPQVGAVGKVGRALTFGGNQYLRVRNHPTLNFDTNSSFSWQAWVKTNATPAINPIMRKGLSGTADLMLSINNGGQAEMGFGTATGASRLFAGPNLRDNQWHQIVVTFIRPNNLAELYVDGVSYGRGGFPGNFTTPDDLLIGSSNAVGYQGQLDQIAIFRHALSAAEVQALYQSASRPSYPATVTGASWSRQVPAGLEGLYQVDLPAVDGVSNSVANGNLWRGLIDNVAPRVTLSGRATGQSYLDTATNTPRYEINYTCRAEDFHLNEAGFTCPGNSQRPPAKSFNNDPLLKQQFPDLTLLSTLVNTYTVWAASPTPTGSLTACDAYGHCTTAAATDAVASGSSTGSLAGAAKVEPAEVAVAEVAVAEVAVAEVAVAAVAVAELVEATGAAPKAVIVDPTNDSALSGSGDLGVTLAAEAVSGLKEVQLLLDGVEVGKLTFAQVATVQNLLRTLIIPMPTVGAHLLSVRASDWSGAQQTEPMTVRLTIYQGVPGVTLDRTTLATADSYGPGTNIYRLSGTVSDPTLDAVRVKVGDQPFASAPVVGGKWQIAYPLFNNGGNLVITVQASNAAGQVGKSSSPVTLDETGGRPIDTILEAVPGNPSGDHGIFRFKGSTLGDVELLAAECSLDGAAYTPCTSPQEYSGLSVGGHSFRVRAVDAEGFVDATPAEFKWWVEGSGPLVEIESGSAPATTDRQARFAFKATSLGDTEALYDCALDGGPYSRCTSPQEYSGLADGEHTFLVRAQAKAGGEPGSPSRFTWRVSNGAPVAQAMAVTVNSNSTVSLTLPATDGDPLRFQIVTKPQHGLLLGLPPALTYTPDSGYAGPDSFTFRATDGELDSNVATVNITVVGLPPTPTATPVAPTATATDTPVATVTNTPEAPTATPIDTPVAPTATATDTAVPPATATNTPEAPTATPTDTPVAPTATATNMPVSTPVGTPIAICGPFTVYQVGNTYSAPGWIGVLKVGTNRNNTINGTSGPDLILGLGGNDKLDGKGGDDLLCAGEGVDLLLGGDGNDFLDGGFGNDVVNGGSGDYDQLLGGDGNDTLLDGNGVGSALGGPGNDLFTIALRNGWRDSNGQPRFTGLTAGYGNDVVGLANLNRVPFFFDISGDEWDEPPSPLEGTNDRLVLVGLRDPASVMIKFEQQLRAASDEAATEAPLSFPEFPTDPTLLTDESGALFLTEPVGGDDVDGDHVVGDDSQVEELSNRLFLPLIAANTP